MFKLKKEIPNFSFVEYWKRSTMMTVFAEKVSITWPAKKISSEDSNVKTTLYSIIKSTTGKLTVQQLSFELSHRGINFVCRLSKTTLHTSIIDLWSIRVEDFWRCEIELTAAFCKTSLTHIPYNWKLIMSSFIGSHIENWICSVPFM